MFFITIRYYNLQILITNATPESTDKIPNIQGNSKRYLIKILRARKIIESEHSKMLHLKLLILIVHWGEISIITDIFPGAEVIVYIKNSFWERKH